MPPSTKESVTRKDSANDAPVSALSLSGPGGTLSLQDDIAAAKKAFPMPRGAKATKAPEFLPQNSTHWGWESTTGVFDAVEEKGRLIWFTHLDKGLTDAQRKKTVEEELDAFGEPAENAEGKYADLYSWEHGDGVRVTLDVRVGRRNMGLLHIIGRGAPLLSQGLPLGSLATLVHAIDEEAKSR
jgi:hypothetical protein